MHNVIAYYNIWSIKRKAIIGQRKSFIWIMILCVFSSGRYKESRERKIDVMNSDLYRYYGKKETFYEYLTRRPEIKYIVLLRKAQKNTGLLKYWYKIRLSFYSRKTQIDIPANTKIGEGLYLGHTGCRIINPNVIIGKNCNIATGVVIGKKNRPGGGDTCNWS